MTNTTTPLPARFQNVATARKALKARGIDADGLQGKALKEAYEAARTAEATAPATPAPAKPGKPAKPAAPATPGNFPLCGCGCGVPTVTAKARFLSGHDARYAGMVGRGERAADPRLATPGLDAKIEKIAATTRQREALKAAKAAANQAAKDAYAAAMATV